MDAGQSCRNEMGRIQDSFALWHPIGLCAKAQRKSSPMGV
ncbi:hypothetical protein B4135_1474 [Caldibacillus debilis]|uniref:Uncharacterized protein n=1 Tax=Caldibacillus debilis TaxID=301148 RepID=A0A150MCZ8_9BACI|nr:hypothetical protein B4135_1474 [Caldibacillus debilis]